MKLKLPFAGKPADAGQVSPAALRSDHRCCGRVGTNCEFVIYGHDPRDRDRYIQARTVNMSQEGALVETKEPIEVASRVYVKVGMLGLMGGASVRYCNRKGSKFRIGLHFPNPLIRPL